MIRIDRASVTAPTLTVTQAHRSVLRQKAKAKTLTPTDFDATVFGAKAVRAALHTMQHGKCAYCEKPIEKKHAHVDHFRPKTRATERDASGTIVSQRTGYYWLAYTFENLLLTCPNCNTHKLDQFPLRPRAGKPGKTARLLDPGKQNPKRHLTFVHDPILGGYVPTFLGPADGRGDHTLRILGLDRDDLVDLRRKYFKKHILPLLEEWPSAPAARKRAIRVRARDLSKPDTDYSAMNRAAFKAAGIL
ncbi:MAG: HNH endonuclease domain-containing protein [Polyangiaceae bacterium]